MSRPKSSIKHDQKSAISADRVSYCIEGWGGIRIEDMVVVVKESSQVLNSLSREIWRV